MRIAEELDDEHEDLQFAWDNDEGKEFGGTAAVVVDGIDIGGTGFFNETDVNVAESVSESKRLEKNNKVINIVLIINKNRKECI